VNFDNAKENRVRMIIGKGQMVFWKGSNVTVYYTDGEGTQCTRKLEGVPNGQGFVEEGVKLYITQGKVIVKE
jgi:hypothetical protein